MKHTRRGLTLVLLTLAGSLADPFDARPRGLTTSGPDSETPVLPSASAATLPPRAANPDRVKPDAGRLFPAYDGAVPVLLYHRLVAGRDGYSVAPHAFDAQLRRLHTLGFEAITVDRYVRFMRGESVDLPKRPVLITFDDAYVSAWLNADEVLARYGWSAVMYVPTGLVGRPGYLTWEELRRMQASGRWQIEEHSGDGHVLVTVDAAGRRGPFYANASWANGRRESFDRYTWRVSNDIQRGAAMLAHELPDWKSHGTFAVPYGNYGQHGSNDRRIEAWLSNYFNAHFAVTFVQNDDSFTRPRPGFANRITVSARWNADTLEMRLLRGLDRLTRDA